MRRAALLRQVGPCHSLVTLGHARRASQPEHHIPAVHALHLADVARRWNIGKEALFSGIVDTASLAEPAAQLSIPTLEKLVARARALTGEPALGIHVGMQMRISAHGYLGFAAMAASSVREALELATRFAPTRTTALDLRVEQKGSSASLVLTEHADFGTARDAVLLALTVGIWQIGTALTGRELGGTIDLVIPAPDYASRLGQSLSSLRFGQRDNRLTFDASVLDLPLVMADPVALRLAREQCERALDALGPAPIAGRVRAMLPRRERGFRSLGEVADALGMSTRTLKRRLAEEATSFSDVTEDARRERAMELLQTTELPLDEIAERLGYSDQANFGRAFRRWTGGTPAAFRRR